MSVGSPLCARHFEEWADTTSLGANITRWASEDQTRVRIVNLSKRAVRMQDKLEEETHALGIKHRRDAEYMTRDGTMMSEAGNVQPGASQETTDSSIVVPTVVTSPQSREVESDIFRRMKALPSLPRASAEHVAYIPYLEGILQGHADTQNLSHYRKEAQTSDRWLKTRSCTAIPPGPQREKPKFKIRVRAVASSTSSIDNSSESEGRFPHVKGARVSQKPRLKLKTRCRSQEDPYTTHPDTPVCDSQHFQVEKIKEFRLKGDQRAAMRETSSPPSEHVDIPHPPPLARSANKCGSFAPMESPSGDKQTSEYNLWPNAQFGLRRRLCMIRTRMAGGTQVPPPIRKMPHKVDTDQHECAETANSQTFCGERVFAATVEQELLLVDATKRPGRMKRWAGKVKRALWTYVQRTWDRS